MGVCGRSAGHVGSVWLRVPAVPPHLSKTVATSLWPSYRPKTSTQHPSLSFPLTSSPPTLRPYQTPELWLLSNPTFSCPFRLDPMFFPLTHSVFLFLRVLTSWAPPGHRLLYSLSNILCPTVPSLYPPGKIPNLLELVSLPALAAQSVGKDTRQACWMAPSLEVEIPASAEASPC